MRKLLILVAWIGVAYVGICLAVFLFQEHLIFFPQKTDPEGEKELFSMHPGLKTVGFAASDGTRISGYFLPRYLSGRLAP